MSAPRWARFLLRALPPRDLTDEVLGDLEEVHRRRLLRHGPTRARLVTALEALDMARALLVHRMRIPSFSWLDFKLGFRMLAGASCRDHRIGLSGSPRPTDARSHAERRRRARRCPDGLERPDRDELPEADQGRITSEANAENRRDPFDLVLEGVAARRPVAQPIRSRRIRFLLSCGMRRCEGNQASGDDGIDGELNAEPGARTTLRSHQADGANN